MFKNSSYYCGAFYAINYTHINNIQSLSKQKQLITKNILNSRFDTSNPNM